MLMQCQHVSSPASAPVLPLQQKASTESQKAAKQPRFRDQCLTVAQLAINTDY